jgi:hypothetical protein
VVEALAPKSAPRDAAQLIVHAREHLLERVCIAGRVQVEKGSDVGVVIHIVIAAYVWSSDAATDRALGGPASGQGQGAKETLNKRG